MLLVGTVASEMFLPPPKNKDSYVMLREVLAKAVVVIRLQFSNISNRHIVIFKKKRQTSRRSTPTLIRGLETCTVVARSVTGMSVLM